MRASIVVIAIVCVRVAHADVGWGVVPFANYNSDAGLGLGVVGTATLREPDIVPYRASVLLQVFATSERVQAHELRWDVVGVGTPRLRLFGRAAYFSTVNSNYCGIGNAVTCDPAVAVAAADASALAGTEREDFVRRYYLVRFLAPSIQIGARWRIRDGSAASVFTQWRASYYRSGGLGDRGPYPGSFYALEFPDGENGFASVAQLGAVYDTRDREGTPSRGMWLEASARGTVGGTWRYAGANAIARVYRTIVDGVVSATRATADVTFGAPPTAELSLVNAADTFVAFGGETAGRGIRERRYLGKVKLIAQEEIRVDVSRRWQLVGFVDLGWIGESLTHVGGDPWRVLGGGGAGARFVHSQTFVLRADVAMSPHEGWSPQIYLNLAHVY